jgi:hypothetical protein
LGNVHDAKEDSVKRKGWLIALVLGSGLVLALLSLLSGSISSVTAAPACRSGQAATGIISVCVGGGCDYSTIQAAVDAAAPGSLIKVAAGTYTGMQNVPSLNTGTFTATQMVVITKSITIQGGYTTSDWANPDPIANPVTLDARRQGRVIVITGTITPTIAGLHIIGGNGTGLGGSRFGDAAGGGVYVSQASATIADCTIYSNTGHAVPDVWGNSYGGGLYLSGSDGATLQGNSITTNTGSTRGRGYGGGLYLDRSDHVTLNGNVVMGNTGTRVGNGQGGGLSLYDSNDVTLDGNVISDNVGTTSANYDGGGVSIVGGSYITLTGNTIRGNLAGAAASWGGGLYLDSVSQVALTGNTIDGNVTTIYGGLGRGGGLYLEEIVDIILSDNLIIGNAGHFDSSTSSWGGGVYIERGGPITLANNVIADNKVTTAGSGLYVEGAALRLLHTTIARNTGGDGSGVCVTDDGGYYSAVALTNTILVSHTVGVTVSTGNTVTIEATLWHGNTSNWDGAGAILHSQDRGGDPAFAGDGYHLTHRSAAIDEGLATGVGTDIDGEPRPAGTACDLGADELWHRIYLPLVIRST